MTGGDRPFALYGAVLSDGRETTATRVEVAEGRIAAVTKGGSRRGAETVADGWIAPGLIDLQFNGVGSIDLTTAVGPEAAIAAVACLLARHGVTAFCPTVISSPPQTVLERLRPFGPGAHPAGATSLGVHLEGPFLSVAHRGAHDADVLRAPDADEIERWLSIRRPAIVTLAPELPDALEAIRRLAAAGTVVSLGHSGADLSTARAALAAGATMGTHLFNGMPPMHHRRPGLVGALLASSATLGVICDGVHVDPLVAQLVVRAAGVERVALVSDAVAAASLPRGASGEAIGAHGGAVRRSDGTLMGSAVQLDTCLRKARSWFDWLSPAQVLLMATATPAAALGPQVASRKGRIAQGYDADLTVLDPDWRVVMTIIGGRVVFRRRGA